MKFREYINEKTQMLAATGYVVTVKVDGKKHQGAPYTFLTTQTFKNDKELKKWALKRASQYEKGKIKIDTIKPL